MDDTIIREFIWVISAIAIAIIVVHIFLGFKRVLLFKWIPERPDFTPESVFKDLQNKKIRIKLKNGDLIDDCTYIKTLFFNDSEFSANIVVYFQVAKATGNKLYLSSSDIAQIEEITPNEGK